jgi:hypothetical protein
MNGQGRRIQLPHIVAAAGYRKTACGKHNGNLQTQEVMVAIEAL